MVTIFRKKSLFYLAYNNIHNFIIAGMITKTKQKHAYNLVLWVIFRRFCDLSIYIFLSEMVNAVRFTTLTFGTSAV